MKLTRNDIKLSFRKPKFQVNQKRGTVKCVLGYEIVPPYDYDGELAQFPAGFRSVEAVAVCQPNDTFDVRKGQKIALAKAENQAYANALEEVSDLDWVPDAAIVMHNMVENFYKKAKKCARHNISYVQKLTE